MNTIRIYKRSELRETGRQYDRAAVAINDDIGKAIAEVPGVQCRKGCNACCRLWVEVLPVEAARIVDYVRKRRDVFDDGTRAAIKQRIDANAAVAASADAGMYRAANRPCAFLSRDGLCRVYAVRPWSCRGMASTDVRVCNREIPDDGTASLSAVPGRLSVFTLATDSHTVEMNGALRDYWERGEIVAEFDADEAALYAEWGALARAGRIGITEGPVRIRRRDDERTEL